MIYQEMKMSKQKFNAAKVISINFCGAAMSSPLSQPFQDFTLFQGRGRLFLLEDSWSNNP